MSTFDQIKYQNEYNKEKYDRITIMVPKGNKDILQADAKRMNMSLNAYINKILENNSIESGT